MKAEITGGEVSDYKGFDALHDDELPQAKVFIADKGYDSDGIRESLETRGPHLSFQAGPIADNPSQSTPSSTRLATASSAASTNSNAPDALQPVTTKPLKAISDSFTSQQPGSGSEVCQHDLSIVLLL